MTTIDIPVIRTNELEAEATYAHPALNVRLVGSAESVALAPLGVLLGKLHREAMRLAVREVTIDVRELEFMNSSCFEAFVDWLGVLQDVERGSQYRIRFLSDDQKHWQRRSLARSVASRWTSSRWSMRDRIRVSWCGARSPSAASSRGSASARSSTISRPGSASTASSGTAPATS